MLAAGPRAAGAVTLAADDAVAPRALGLVEPLVGGARERCQAPGVVYMSGDTARAAVRRQPGTEQSLFLRKPFAPSALLSAAAAARR